MSKTYNSDKWKELFEWIKSQPSYIDNQVYGLEELYYTSGDNTFELDGNRITIYYPKTGGAAVEIECGMGGVTFEPYTAGADCKFVDNRDIDFPEVAEKWVATMKLLNTDELVVKIKSRIIDEINERASSLEKARQERIDREKARLKRELQKLEELS